MLDEKTMRTVILFLFFIGTVYSQTIIRVPQDYDKIQTALDSSSTSDTILVSQGVYKENIIINKPVTIIGDTNSKPVITSDSLYLAAIYINTSSVLLRNIHIKKAPANEAVMIENSDNCIIDECMIDTNVHILSFTDKNYFYGIYVLSSKNIMITNTVIKDNKGGSYYGYQSVEGSDAIGINIEKSSDVGVRNCQIYNNKRGESSNGLYGNGTGIKIINSANNILIRNCSIYKNNTGILFDYTNSIGTVGGSPQHANYIYKNSDYNINNKSDTTINATYNYWGTSNKDSISSKIWGKVNYSDFITGVHSDKLEIPKTLILSQNYPNPFNPSTHIKYVLPSSGIVKINIYDSIGRLVAEVLNRYQYAGMHEVLFNGENLSSAVYYYMIEYKGRRLYKKMILLK